MLMTQMKPTEVQAEADARAARGECQVPGCPNPLVVRKHRCCWGHYKKLLRTGSFGGLLRPIRRIPPANLS